jgi:hypothetical protein
MRIAGARETLKSWRSGFGKLRIRKGTAMFEVVNDIFPEYAGQRMILPGGVVEYCDCCTSQIMTEAYIRVDVGADSDFIYCLQCG